MALRRIAPVVLLAILLGGCPTGTTSDGDATPPDWLNGNWIATATATGESVSGCVTIAEGRITTWGHGCAGQNMSILDAPLATQAGNTTTVSVTVLNTSSLLMQVTMYLTKTNEDLLTGSITTVSLGQTPFIGTVTMQRR
jgi:hypothetical protein